MKHWGGSTEFTPHNIYKAAFSIVCLCVCVHIAVANRWLNHYYLGQPLNRW